MWRADAVSAALESQRAIVFDAGIKAARLHQRRQRILLVDGY